jgi:hypothetical protein
VDADYESHLGFGHLHTTPAQSANDRATRYSYVVDRDIRSDLDGSHFHDNQPDYCSFLALPYDVVTTIQGKPHRPGNLNKLYGNIAWIIWWTRKHATSLLLWRGSVPGYILIVYFTAVPLSCIEIQ